MTSKLQLLFLSLLLTPLFAQSRAGQTFDQCSDSSECKGDRQCKTIDIDGGQSLQDCSGSELCACVPFKGGDPDFKFCKANENCENGELCSDIGFLGFAARICVAQEALNPEANGFTLDRCMQNSDCNGKRRCFNADLKPCSGNEICACSNVNNEGAPVVVDCTTAADCPKGETCVQAADQVLCVSEDAVGTRPTIPPPSSTPTASPSTSPSAAASVAVTITPTPDASLTPEPTATGPGTVTPAPIVPEESVGEVTESPPAETSSEGSDDDDEDPVCIDARRLMHMDKEDLVFDTHRKATVLCDEKDSCATPGHMVYYKEMAMRMSSYCKIVRCERRKMLVNSPKYSRKMRVQSMSEGLEFTVFAARWDTWAEEVVLRRLVHAGL